MSATVIEHRSRAAFARRLATPRTALIVGAVELALFIVAIPLASAGHQLNFSGYWSNAVVAIPFAIVAMVVAYRRPEHPMGWIMFAFPGLWALSLVLGLYALVDFRFRHHLPLASVAAIVQPTWELFGVALALGIIVYPDGRLPSRRWRWPVRWALGLMVGSTLVAIAYGTALFLNGTARIDSSGAITQLDGNKPWAVWAILASATIATVGLMLVAWVVGQGIGLGRLSAERRAQQKWIITGAAISVAALFTQLSGAAWASVAALAVGALPVAMGIGVLRYRLYDIDRLLSRTLAYALLTVMLGGAFTGLVLLSTDVLPFSSTAGVAASTLAAAALFNPLRVRVQHAVDRRFNRARYDAEETVAAFSARLRDAVDLDAVRSELLATVQTAVEPAHATVWLRPVARKHTP